MKQFKEYVRPFTVERVIERIISRVEDVVDEETVNLNEEEIKLLVDEKQLRQSIVDTIYDELERNLL